MKLNRRNFILSLAGGLIGINFTPLPWKLMDDIAIWTQNWPWVPVPEKGRFHFENSVCTLCPGGCGIKIREVDGIKGNRAVKIEGRTDYPINPGGICPIGMGGLQLLYDESLRFTGPMKRAGLRGAGVFTNTSWNKAINTLTEKIKELRNNGTPEKLLVIDGSRRGSTCALMIERLVKAIGSPNYVRLCNMEDTYSIASLLMTGKESPMAFDLENSDYVLSFGCALIDGWGSPGRIINVWSMWRGELKDKVKIVQIESRVSDTASKANKWISVKPGTETALALGIAYVLIKQKLYDKNFIENHTFGFKDWISNDGQIHTGFKNMILKRYSLDKVSSITGVSEKEIISIAKEFAKAKAPIAICGREKGDLPGSVYEYMAIMALNALVGSINRPGGILIQDPIPFNEFPEIPLDNIAKEGLKKTRLDQAGTNRAPFTHSLAENLAENMKDVEMVMIFSSNPVYTIPNTNVFKKALEKVPFIVTFSPFRDDTSLIADLVLPDHMSLEKVDEVIWPPGLQYPFYGLSKPIIDPIYNTRHMGDVIIEIAKNIGGNVAKAFPWNKYEDVIKYRVKGLVNANGSVEYNSNMPVWQLMKNKKSIKICSNFSKLWKKIKENGFWFKVPDAYGKLSFSTISGKFEFFSQRLMQHKRHLKDMGINKKSDEAFMPHYEEIEVQDYNYPIVMIPYEMINLSTNNTPSPPFVYKTIFDTQLKKDDSFVDINPSLANKLNLSQGDKIIIRSPAGSIKVRVNITELAMPNAVHIPMGFGHQGYDEFIRNKGVNPNNIIYGKTDPIGGHKIWWNTPVKIVKA